MSRRPRRKQRWLVLLAVLAAGGVVAWPRVERHDLFRVDTVELRACPDELRAEAHQVLRPVLGQSIFRALARRARLEATLAALPEAADARVTCRPPNRVELILEGRRAEYAVATPRGWLEVDDEGVILRVRPRPASALTQVRGLVVSEPTPAARLAGDGWRMVTGAASACEVVLGRRPRSVAVEPGGAVRLRTAGDGLVLLGEARDLETKLKVYRAALNRLPGPARYIDVSVPEAPAWRPREDAAGSG